LAVLFAAVTLALCFAGCGDDEPATSTVTSTATVSDSTSSSTSSSTTAATTTTDPDEGGKLSAFTSPSGNIGCILDRGGVRCDIGKRDWEPPKRPASCNENLDYGQGIDLRAGAKPAFVCAGDTTLGAGPELEYGHSAAMGLITCKSEESGVTCRDIESGRGFTISTERYELF
jgi:hypothetical protein